MTRWISIGVLAVGVAAANVDARQLPPGAVVAPRNVPAPAEKAPQEVEVDASLSRTAVWVGDRVEYVVEIVLAPTADVVVDDLAHEKLKAEGLEVLGSGSEREPVAGGGAIHRVRYQLAAYDVAIGTARISPLTVRYYTRRPGQRPEDVQPSGEIVVPGASVAVRSTLPDDNEGVDVRDVGTLRAMPETLRLARPVGLGLMLLAAAPLAVWGLTLVQRSRSRVKRTSVRSARSQTRAALEELRGIDAGSGAARIEGYGRLAAVLRQHLAQTKSVPALALSAGEITARLDSAGAGSTGVLFGELIAQCERARYAPPDRLPPADRFREAVDEASRLVEGMA